MVLKISSLPFIHANEWILPGITNQWIAIEICPIWNSMNKLQGQYKRTNKKPYISGKLS
jgi:hypothetical protein